jgi:sec-independent protein translocase protein TatA
MGFSGINVTQLLVILAIVLVVFGTKRVKSLGSDLGGAIKGFRGAMDTDTDDDKGTAHAHGAARQRRIESGKEADPDAGFSERTDNAKHG